MTTTTTTTSYSIEKNIVLAYGLWFFLGQTFCAHRLYTGRIKSAVLYIILAGFSVIAAITVIGLVVAIPILVGLGLWWLADGVLMLNWGLVANTKITKTTEVE